MKATRYIPFLAAMVLIPALTSRFSATPADVASTAKSSINAVTVYLDRAVVTRTAAVDLPAGENTISFENLPAALTDQSLNASARGVAGASILDVGAAVVFTEAAPNEKVKQLEDEIKALQKQIRVLDDRGKILEQERSFVERMLQASTTVVGPGPTPDRTAPSRPSLEEWQKLMLYSNETFGKLAEEQQSLDTKKEDLQNKRTAAERSLNELRGARGRQSKTVKVRMALTAPGKLDVSIQYAVPNASWTPSYDARLRSADRMVELSYYGVVRNGTGEDWKDVSLTLSTARPSLGGGAPELRPWITSVSDVSVQTKSLSSSIINNAVRQGTASAPTNQAFNGFGGGAAGGGGGGGRGRGANPADAPPPIVEAAILAAGVEAGVSSATFKIAVPVTVPGNNVTQKVSINSNKLMATLQYQSTPKTMEAAFLSAYAVNGSEYPLLAGAMNTFLDETFIASSALKTVMPGEKFELQLGADDGIKVKRRVVNRFHEDTGLSNKGRKVTYEYLISFTNNKTTTEKLVFKEPTPVSRDEKITVKIITPAEKEIGTLAAPKEVTREEDGKLVWRVNLDPGQKRDFTLKLSIEYPSDVTISGLE